MILFTTGVNLGDESREPKHLKKFVRFMGCEFLDMTYADGDSFKGAWTGLVRADGFRPWFFCGSSPVLFSRPKSCDGKATLDFMPIQLVAKWR